MTYQDLLNTINIISNSELYKENLTMIYELDPTNHKKMQEHIYYKSENVGETIIYSDLFEIDINGVLIKFIKKNLE